MQNKKIKKSPYLSLLERSVEYQYGRMQQRLKACVRGCRLEQASCSARPPIPRTRSLSSSLLLFKGKTDSFSMPGGVRLNTEMATGKRLEGKTKDRGVKFIRSETELQACRTPIQRNSNRFHLTQSAIITAEAELIKKLAFLIVVCSHRDVRLNNAAWRRCSRSGHCDVGVCYYFLLVLAVLISIYLQKSRIKFFQLVTVANDVMSL